LATSGRRPLWIDATRFSACLLTGGSVPWFDAAGFVAWRRQTQGLVKSDVVDLTVGPLFAAAVTADPGLRAAMAGKRRIHIPLKVLLSAEMPRRQVRELLEGLRGSFTQCALALVCPSPRAWLQDAFRLAHGEDAPPVGEDEVDSATLYCADFLREFGSSGVDGILLEETQESEPGSAGEVEWYRSVLNVGAHYGWDMGWRSVGDRYSDAQVPSFDYCIAPRPLGAECSGIEIAEDYWRGAPMGNSTADFYFGRVPPGLVPEVVLDRLAQLRSSA